MNESIVVNDVPYRRPQRPVVVVCIDGGDPAYLDRYTRAGELPNIARFIQDGFATVATGSLPAFTCPNNMSIITGVPTSRHGISGNFYLDTQTWQPVVMTGPELLRAETVLAGFARAGARVVSITAKDKLRRQLGKDLDVRQGHVSFSSEFADRCTLDENGIEDVPAYVGMARPDMYSAELSLFVLQAGLRLLRDRRPDLMYLSLTDFVQHTWAPEAPQALAFYRQLDEVFGLIAAENVVLGLTADHGMNDKSGADDAPNVLWLQDTLDEAFGADRTVVVCPITDAFVAHHGALGGFVRVWTRDGVDVDAVIDRIRRLDGVELALDRDTACRMFDLPPDREADVVVIARRAYCIGRSADQHDLSGLRGTRLRTHGGLSETAVPFILNRPLNAEYRRRAACERIDSYRIFDYAINGTR